MLDCSKRGKIHLINSSESQDRAKKHIPQTLGQSHSASARDRCLPRGQKRARLPAETPHKTGHTCTNPKGNSITCRFPPAKAPRHTSPPSAKAQRSSQRRCAVVTSTETKHGLFPAGSQEEFSAALRLFSWMRF